VDETEIQKMKDTALVVLLLLSLTFFVDLFREGSAVMDRVEARKAWTLNNESWFHYTCNGTERRHAQACLKEEEALSSWLVRQMQSNGYEQLACYIDKAAIKHHVHAVAKGVCTPSTLGLFTDENMETLLHWQFPTQYVMKATHGSHMALIIHHGHLYTGNEGKLRSSQFISRIEVVELARKFTTKCYSCLREAQYRRARRAVIVEEFLGPDFPNDYNIFMFGGQVHAFDMRRFTVSNVESGRLSMRHHRFVSDGQSELTPKQVVAHFKYEDEFPPKHAIQQMLRASKLIADGFRFARVDFYYVNGSAYFGELTLSPQAGSRRLDKWFHPKITMHIGLCNES